MGKSPAANRGVLLFGIVSFILIAGFVPTFFLDHTAKGAMFLLFMIANLINLCAHYLRQAVNTLKGLEKSADRHPRTTSDEDQLRG